MTFQSCLLADIASLLIGYLSEITLICIQHTLFGLFTERNILVYSIIVYYWNIEIENDLDVPLFMACVPNVQRNFKKKTFLHREKIKDKILNL